MHYPLPAPRETETIEPSLWYALFGLPFCAIGILLFAYTFVSGMRQVTASLTEIVVPGGVLLELQAGQTYTVFQEKGTLVKGNTYAWPQFDDMLCTVTKVSTSQIVELRRPATRSTYSWGGRQGSSLIEFTVPSPGQYDFTCQAKGDAAVPQAVVAIGAGVGANLGKMFAQCFFSLLVGWGLGLTIFLVIVVQRERSKRRIRAEGRRPV